MLFYFKKCDRHKNQDETASRLLLVRRQPLPKPAKVW